MTQVVSVHINGDVSGRYYDFFTDLDLKVGDSVVCETVKGLVVAVVVSIEALSQKATQWIVTKVDLTAHEERKQRRAKLAELKRKMNARKKKLEDETVYAYLAQLDPEMACLLAEYRLLKE